MRRLLLRFLLLWLLLLIAFGCAAGYLLVQNNPQKSDAIVVLAGGSDARVMKGMELLRSGFGKTLFVDAVSDRKLFGMAPADYAETYLQKVAGDQGEHVKVCPVQENSTISEIQWITRCLDSVSAKSVVLVTSEGHTRRALSVMRTYEPRYEWTVAASHDPQEFDVKWWQHREWAKMLFEEWVRMIWWQGVDRWRDHPHYGRKQ